MPSKPAISSMSLGRAWEHALFDKVQEASLAGFEGIEIFYEDLEYLATTYSSAATGSQHARTTPQTELLKAASEVSQWCKTFNLAIIALQPFMYAEGLKDRAAHQQKLEELKFWFELCRTLGTDMILFPTTFLPTNQVSRNLDSIVADLSEAVSLAEESKIRIAFEDLAWGTHINTWERAYEIVETINSPNLGICLDTFNILGRIWADPTRPDGKVGNADEILEESLERLKEIDKKKIFFIQLIDAERLSSPLVEGHAWYKPDQPARMSWSRNARTFYGNGYLPVDKVAKVIFEDLRWEGWVSMELFHRQLGEKEEGVPKRFAEAGFESWKRLKGEIPTVGEGGRKRPGISRFQSSFGGALDI